MGSKAGQYFRKRTEPNHSSGLVATEELRQYASDREWFIPVLLSECDIPARSIGAGKTLQDLQRLSLYEDWETGIQRILSVIKPTPPEIRNLRNALRSEDKRIRYQAIKALVEIGSPVTLPALIEALKNEDQNVRLEAVKALGRIGPEAKAAMPALIEALKNKDWEVRWSAAQALGKIGPEAKAAVPALIETRKDWFGGEWLWRNAAVALEKIDPEAVPDLIKALKDPDKRVRLYATQTLGFIGPKAKIAVPALIEALKDEGVRWLAKQALEKINTPEAQKALEEYKKKSK